MPSPQGLQYIELSKFKGLWTNGGRHLMPADHAQVMSGCHPQKGGGIRAFYKPANDVTAAGLSGHLGKRIRGFGVMPDSLNALDQAVGNRYFAIMSNINSTDYRLFRRSNFNGDDTAAWTAVTTGVTFSGQPQVGELAHPWFARYALATGIADVNVHFLELNTIGAGAGLYSLSGNPSGSTLTAHAVYTGDLYHGPVIGHQSRLVLAAENGIMATAPSSTLLNPAPPVIIVPGNNGLNKLVAAVRYGRVAWLLPIPPTDLLVGMSDGHIFNIQGSLADPVIRDLGQWGRTLSQEPVNTAHGPIIIFPRLGPQVFSPDGRLHDISQELDPEDWDMPGAAIDRHFGSTAAAEQFYYAPNFMDRDVPIPTTLNNGPLIRDFGTSAWFTGVHPDVQRMTNPRWIVMATGRHNPGVFVARYEPISTVSDVLVGRFPAGISGVVGVAPEPAIRRSWKYEWKSAPLREPSGRQIEILEIQIATLGWGVTQTMTLTLTNEDDESVSQVVDIPEGKSNVIVPLRHRGDYLELTIAAEALDHAVEAPMLESVRMGWRPGHRR